MSLPDDLLAWLKEMRNDPDIKEFAEWYGVPERRKLMSPSQLELAQACANVVKPAVKPT